MTLVREVQLGILTRREHQLKEMVEYLKSLGTEARLIKESAKDDFGRDIRETVIVLNNQVINRIRLESNVYVLNNHVTIALCFHYEMYLNKPLPTGSKREIEAKVKFIKMNKVLGIFGGEVIDAEWVGGVTAKYLALDTELSRLLVEKSRCGHQFDLRIKVQSPYVIEIVGPESVESMMPADYGASGEKKSGIACNQPLEFSIYSRIGRTVGDAVSQVISDRNRNQAAH